MRFRRNLFITAGASFSVGLSMLAFTALRHHGVPGADTASHTLPQTAENARIPAGAPSTTPVDPCRSLYRWVCSKKGTTRDPTGIVRPDVEGEKIALKIYEDIIHQHTGWTSEQVNEELVRQIYTPSNVGRIESAHHWVLRVMEQIIDSQPDRVFNDTEKGLLKSRLRRTELQIPYPVSAYGDESYIFTKNDVFYERTMAGKLRLRIGGAYFFTARSWFNQVFTMGHELAHSIDPCEIRAARISIPAYDRLAACFIDRGLVAVPNGRSECGENDQLSETFADWFAAQVTAEALRGFSMEFRGQALHQAAANAVRDLCEQNDPPDDGDLDTEYHPSPRVRIAQIFGLNPQIREILGCSADGGATSSPLAQTAGPTTATGRIPSGTASSSSSGRKPYCGFDYKPRAL